jgi:conjugative transfer region protein TrbK
MRSPIAKRRVINWYFVGPVIGYVLTAVAIVAAVIYFAHHYRRSAAPYARAVYITSIDGLARELTRCQAIGARAANEPDCIAAWAANRRRFFNGGSTETRPAAAKSGEAAQP